MHKRYFISAISNILSSPIEYLTGISALRGDLLRKELSIFTFKDLLEFYPFRHIDKTRVDKIATINPTAEFAQVSGRLTGFNIMGEGRSKRLVAYLQDETGEIELTWFQGISWVEKTLEAGRYYLAYGKPAFFMSKLQMSHSFSSLGRKIYTCSKEIEI